MMPSEFWNSTYREVFSWINEKVKFQETEAKNNISLFNNLGDKLLAGGLTAKKPKEINLMRDVYSNLFKDELEKLDIYNAKPREGEELTQFMKELSAELNQEKG